MELFAGCPISRASLAREVGIFDTTKSKGVFPPHTHQTKKASRPTVPCDGPRMNPSVDVGCPPRPFRHLRMAQRRTPDLSSSRAPVHSALVQKSVTRHHHPAGRLSIRMLGKTAPLGKCKTAKSWHPACNQSNPRFTNALAHRGSFVVERLLMERSTICGDFDLSS